MNDFKERYCKIIESGNAEQLIAFLKTLDEKARKGLVPLIKKDVKRLSKYSELSKGRWGIVGTKNQLDMLGVATVTCYSRKDCKSIPHRLLHSNYALDKALAWCCPEWLTDYINSFNDQIPLNYEQISDWLTAGYLSSVSPEIIALAIAYSSLSLEKHALTLDSHIWTIFHHSCGISLIDRWYPNEEKPSGAGEQKWIYIFIKYTQNNRIDRMRVLKECLLAVNRNFNREQTCWYASLLIALEPKPDECLQLQDELFSAFLCPQTKPINTALQMVGKIIEHSEFHVDDFIAQLPVLFSSTTKGIINSSLMLADKLAKRHLDKKTEICCSVTNIFLSKDVSLQTKAAKLLVKYGEATDPELSALLMSYTESLLSDARELLADFLDAQTVMTDEPEEITAFLPLMHEDNRIPEVETWDDFIFFAGRTFLNLESYHFDQLPAVLLRFAPEINGGNVSQLESAFLQAMKALDSISHFEGMLACFFLEYAGDLISRFPQHTHQIQSIHERFLLLKNSDDRWKKIDWGFHPYDQEDKKRCRSWIEFFKNVLLLLKNNVQLPLLSTPTHLPCFIDPTVFVLRLAQYQQVGVEPGSQDMQLAIQRCVFTGPQPDISHLNTEYAALVRYLFSGEQQALTQIEHDEWKLAAIITRCAVAPDTNSFDIGYSLLEKHGLPMELLSTLFPWFLKENSVSGSPVKTFNFDVTTLFQRPDTPMFYADSFMPCAKYSYFGGEYKRRTIYAFPWQCDVTLMRFIEMNFHDTRISSTSSSLEILQALYDLPLALSPMGHLLIALCMLHADKTVRALAGELWLNKLRHPQGVNSTHIGDILGRLEKENWAPLKRFTDLTMQSLLNISARHNRALLEMVCAMDSHLSTVKITNYKKLTELKLELTRKS
ncbi:hypothetical protein EYW98_13635 [Escherichia coli]|uniref:DUF6493 family protein n=1 Tax=Escherichia sp. MOD1-EC7003 TaxID=2093900 RepID=UPI000CF78CD1|nr:DUF6493 family protein [Escherichia sp. MOD1-EC7003]EGO8360473.1 hypothetical protein [Escherichia coli]EGO8377961.1 hypothetical protein [Escherichia coli]